MLYRLLALAVVSLCAIGLTDVSPLAAQEGPERAKVIMIAGKPSHAYGSHEHNAGCRLLAETIRERGLPIDVEVVFGQWPENLADADSIVIYSDGGGGHPALKHLDELAPLMERGVGLVCLHYAVEVPTDRGGPEFLKWLGGYFETHWSVNPTWMAQFSTLPNHPVTAGVQPFESYDEWYYHMRFHPEAERLTPILSAVPPASTMTRPDGPHSGNPAVRKAVAAGEPQVTAWTFDRPGGGRSFGFTGGHFHWNWGRPEYLQLVTNGIAWTAGVDPVAAEEHADEPEFQELLENQDEQPPKDFSPEKTREQFKLTSAGGPASNANASQRSATAAGEPKPLYRSGLVTTQTSRHQVDIDVPLQGKKKLFLVVTDGGNGFSCDWADWLEPTLIFDDGTRRPLTEIQWEEAASGWGKVQVNRNVAGNPLKVRTTPAERGIGTHANSVIEYDLPPGVRSFEAVGALDAGGTEQADGKQSSVEFLVYADAAPRSIATVAAPAEEQRKPENAVAGLDIHEGLDVHLAASEPTLKSLTNIDVDHRGRVWACEVVNYRQHRDDRPEGDRILILEDENGDGMMDSSKVFYQGRDIDSALGICVLGDRVLVSAAPYVLEFIDRNGDDLPDEKRAVFTQTGDPQHDHSVHSFVIGPDNRLYFNFGNTGHRLRDAQGNPFKDPQGRVIDDSGKPYRQGMAFRCELDFSSMEVVGHNFRNNYELAVDSFGSIWQSDNDDDGNRATRINFVMEYGNYGYTDEVTGDSWRKPRTNLEAEIPQQHWHLNDPGVVPTMLITGAGSPTGIIAYEGDMLPEVFRDTVIHCDAGPNVVRAYPVQDDGAGYSASIENLVEGTRDKWFRPADVCVAPDGSLFVSDWYDPGVGGHHMADTERGRLFRIAAPGVAYRVPQYDLSSVEGAIAALQNPNNSVRYLAMQKLIADVPAAESHLARLLEQGEPRMAARALWMLANSPTTAEKYIAKTLRSENADLRIASIRAARMADLSESIFVDPLLNDPSPQVRRAIAVALREDRSEKMPERWARLASRYDGDDRWMLEALGIAAEGRWDACLAAYLEGREVSAKDDALADIIWRSRATRTSELIVRLLEQDSLPNGRIDEMFRAMDFQAEQQKQQALNGLLDLAGTEAAQASDRRDRIVTEAAVRLNDPAEAMQRPEVAAAVRRHVESLGDDPRQLAILEALNIPGFAELLISRAIQWGETSEGVKALELALKMGGRPALIMAVQVSPEADPTKAARIVRILALSKRDGVQPILESLVSKDDVSPDLRLPAASGLARSEGGQRKLIELAEAGRLPADAMTVVAAELRSSSDGKIAAAADKLFPSFDVDDVRLPPMSELVEMRGDASKGRELFFGVATCGQCHTVRGTGKNVGPDLSEIGDKLTREAMYVSIMNPSAGISHNYEMYVALTADGDVINGLLVNKSEDEIILKDKDGIERKYAIADIEEMKKADTSLMPENLHRITKLDGLVDIVEYMTTLRKPK